MYYHQPKITDISMLNSSLTAEDSLKFRFATDGEGNYGYLGADDSFIPFKSISFNNIAKVYDSNATVEIDKKYLIFTFYNGASDIPTPKGCEIISESNLISYSSSISGRFLYVKATSTTINIQDRFIFYIKM